MRAPVVLEATILRLFTPRYLKKFLPVIVHVDGARLGCAVAALGVEVSQLLQGVDVVSFGGTKHGILLGEAVVFLNSALSQNFSQIKKCSMQLASKMRYLAAQFEGLLEGNLWVENGRHANAMAKKLFHALEGLPGIQIQHSVDTNAVFAKLSPERISQLEGTIYHNAWDPSQGLFRWMCSFDTQEVDIEALLALLSNALQVA